jgi:GT2 family glycosyltransferase
VSAPTIKEYQSRAHQQAVVRAAPSRSRLGNREAGAPLISVVTVVRNAAATLERTIRSVLEQNFPSVEYIVIDGGSTDGSLEIIRRHEDRIACWLSEPDTGIFDAMNKGVALATGEYVAILNADDYYEPAALQCVAEAIGTERPDVVYTDFTFVVDDVGLAGRVTATADLRRGMTLCHPGMFVRRDVYERHGLYETKSRYSSDYDLALRLHLAGVRFVKVAEPLVCFRSGGAAEQHLVRASCEALASIRRQAGVLATLPYLCMFLKRAALRGTNACVRVICGKRAYLWVKRRHYTRRGFALSSRRACELRPAADSIPPAGV